MEIVILAGTFKSIAKLTQNPDPSMIKCNIRNYKDNDRTILSKDIKPKLGPLKLRVSVSEG